MIDHCTMVLYFCHGGNLTNNPPQPRNWWSEIVVMWLCIGNRVFHCCPDVYKAVLVVAYKLKVLIPKVLSLKKLYCPSCFSFPPCKFKQFLKRSGWKNHSFPFLLPPVIAFAVAMPNVARVCKNVKLFQRLAGSCLWDLVTCSCGPSLRVCILTWVRRYAHFSSLHTREHTRSTLHCLCGLPLAAGCREKVCVCSPKTGFEQTAS